MNQTSPRKLVLAAALTVLALSTAAGHVPAVGQTADTAAAVDPAALTALTRMAAYLQTLVVFRVEVATEREDVLDNGLKVQFDGLTSLLVRKPDRVRADVSSDRQDRQYFYDGKQFTLWARRLNLYATAPAPPTVGELVNVIEERYGIEFPLVDLFRWGTAGASSADITDAVDLGPSDVGGTNCRHYALRQAGLDWQIWIQQGDFPLPRKLVLTTTTDEARPQFQATYAWNLAPSFNDADFAFDPPTGAQRISFDEVSPDAGADKKGN